MSILNYGNLSYSSVEPDLYSVIDFNYFHRCVESSIPSAFSDSEVSYLNWLSDLIVVKSVPIVMKNNGFNIITRVPSTFINGCEYSISLGNRDWIKIVCRYDEWYYVMATFGSLPFDYNCFVKCDTFDGVKELFSNLMIK